MKDIKKIGKIMQYITFIASGLVILTVFVLNIFVSPYMTTRQIIWLFVVLVAGVIIGTVGAGKSYSIFAYKRRQHEREQFIFMLVSPVIFLISLGIVVVLFIDYDPYIHYAFFIMIFSGLFIHSFAHIEDNHHDYVEEYARINTEIQMRKDGNDRMW